MFHFDDFVEKRQAVKKTRYPLGVFIGASIDEPLPKARSIAFVHARAKYQPGQDRREDVVVKPAPEIGSMLTI